MQKVVKRKLNHTVALGIIFARLNIGEVVICGYQKVDTFLDKVAGNRGSIRLTERMPISDRIVDFVEANRSSQY